MKKNVFLIAAVATLFLTTVGVNAGFAMKNVDAKNSGGKKDSTQTEHTMDHSGIDSGKKFGEHVSGHAQQKGGFSGNHNPGKMHQGYSGIKKNND